MTTNFDQSQQFPAPPHEVMAMLLDPDYVVAKCLASGSQEATADVITEDGHTTLISRRVLPAKLPSFAKRFVGETLTLIETQQWHEPQDDARTATFMVDFGNNPISFHGSISVQPLDEGTRVSTKGQIRCTVPFVGGKIEGVAAEWIQKYLDKEELVAAEWLARG